MIFTLINLHKSYKNVIFMYKTPFYRVRDRSEYFSLSEAESLLANSYTLKIIKIDINIYPIDFPVV